MATTTETLVAEANQAQQQTVWAASSHPLRMLSHQYCEQDGGEYGIYWQEILQPELPQGTSHEYGINDSYLEKGGFYMDITYGYDEGVSLTDWCWRLWQPSCKWQPSCQVTAFISSDTLHVKWHPSMHAVETPGPLLNIKTILPRYRDSHVKDKMVVRPSYIIWKFLYQ